MATLFGSPPPISHSTASARNHHVSLSSSQPQNSQTPTPPPTPPQPSQSQSMSTSSSDQQPPIPVKPTRPTNTKTKADSTDWISSSLTRRFGLGAGLAWVGFLAAGVVSEQIKTRLEVSQQESNTRDVEKEVEVLLPNGIRYGHDTFVNYHFDVGKFRNQVDTVKCDSGSVTENYMGYYEIKVGGGATPRAGDLVVIDLKGKVEGSGEVFVNTFDGERRPLALVMGSRPYTKGMCEGIENVLRSMKAGGKRRVIVPPTLGFGEKGADLGSGIQIPPFATLEYIIEVDRVSIAPA